MMRYQRLTFALLCLATSGICVAALQAQEQKHSVVPKKGFVPNSATAKQIAEAVWIPIYGKETIMAQKPFSATLSRGVWTVVGSLKTPKKGYISGGVAIAEIAQKDARILRVSHGR